MSEAQNGVAVLPDVDNAAFARFIDWLYHKDYKAMKPRIRLPTASHVDIAASVDSL